VNTSSKINLKEPTCLNLSVRANIRRSTFITRYLQVHGITRVFLFTLPESVGGKLEFTNHWAYVLSLFVYRGERAFRYFAAGDSSVESFMNYAAASSVLSSVNVMPDLIRHPAYLLDAGACPGARSGIRRNDSSQQAARY